MDDPENAPPDNEKLFSDCRKSEKYFDMVSHQIPISDLYKLIKSWSNSEQNPFCAILLQIVHPELQNKYEGRYQLNVWTNQGEIVY